MYKYIVYGLIDPNDKDIRYIGKSMSGMDRAHQHYTSSSLKVDGNTHKANWIRKLKDNNQKYEIVILFHIDKTVDLDKNTINLRLYEKEQELINFYRKSDNKLTNLQDGGPGSPDRQISEETRKKMSESAKKRGLNKALLEQQKPKHPIFENKRYCSKCNQIKDLEFFKKDKNNHVCKPCNLKHYGPAKNLKRRLETQRKKECFL